MSTFTPKRKTASGVEDVTLPISAIPVGTIIHNVELYPGKGGQLVRSAGTYAHNYESITVTATDPLGALEDLKVDDPYFEGSFYIYDENNIIK